MCYLYATFGAVPSRSSGFALELIIVLVLGAPSTSSGQGLAVQLLYWVSFVSSVSSVSFVSSVSKLFLAVLAVQLTIVVFLRVLSVPFDKLRAGFVSRLSFVSFVSLVSRLFSEL